MMAMATPAPIRQIRCFFIVASSNRLYMPWTLLLRPRTEGPPPESSAFSFYGAEEALLLGRTEPFVCSPALPATTDCLPSWTAPKVFLNRTILTLRSALALTGRVQVKALFALLALYFVAGDCLVVAGFCLFHFIFQGLDLTTFQRTIKYIFFELFVRLCVCKLGGRQGGVGCGEVNFMLRLLHLSPLYSFICCKEKKLSL